LQLPGVLFKPVSDLPAQARVDLSCIYLTDNQSPILQSFLATVRDADLS
jgi:LysR family transcriptional regulator, benzoate and cis,cis-muconate-responsive activator of ben and cat genes